MSPEKFKQLWKQIIAPAIKEFLDNNKDYRLEYGSAEANAGLEGKLENLKEFIEGNYNSLKPYFKEEYMKKYDKNKSSDKEAAEDGDIRADRHKVAALLYLALTYDIQTLFIRLQPMNNKNKTFDFLAAHAVAYDVSLNCLHSFIDSANKKTPDPNKQQFLNNGGFNKKPPLICEGYAEYRDSLIPRMIWATEEASKFFNTNDPRDSFREMRIATNANMLANIFYFLELYSSL